MTVPVVCLCGTIQLIEVDNDPVNLNGQLIRAAERKLTIQSISGSEKCWSCKAELTLDIQLNLMVKGD